MLRCDKNKIIEREKIMKRKLLSLLLILTLVISMVGCSNKEKKPTAKTILQKMSSIEINAVDTEVELKSETGSLSFLIHTIKFDSENYYVSIDAKMSLDKYVCEEYMELTNIYFVDTKDVYVDIKQVVEYLSNLDSQFAMISGFLKLPADYVVISEEDLGAYSIKNNFPSISISEVVIEKLGTLIDEWAEKTGETVTTIADDKITLSVNPENIQLISEAVSTIDFETCYNEIASSVGTIPLKQGLNDNIKDYVEEAKNNNVVLDSSLMVSEEGLVIVDGSTTYNNGSGDVIMTINMVSSADKKSEFDVPTETMTYEELKELLSMLSDFGN